MAVVVVWRNMPESAGEIVLLVVFPAIQIGAAFQSGIDARGLGAPSGPDVSHVAEAA